MRGQGQWPSRSIPSGRTEGRTDAIGKEPGNQDGRSEGLAPGGDAEPPIRSLTGSTREGAPLSLSKTPADDISSWFYWISVAEGELPSDLTVRCGMLGDQACIRLIWGGVWTAETLDGHQVFDPGEEGITLYFGPQTRYMPVSVTGSYRVIR